MTGTYAPTIPTIGQPNSTEDVDIKEALETLRDAINATLNATNEVDGAKIASATILDASLKSPGSGLYRVINSSSAVTTNELVAGTYILNGGSLVVDATEIETAINSLIYFDDADYAATGKTIKLRLRAQAAVNATKGALKYTFGLYPITVAGGALKLKPTLGAVVENSKVELNEPAASTITQGNSGDFTVPADGAYVLGVVTSAKLTANCRTSLTAQLQVRNV